MQTEIRPCPFCKSIDLAIVEGGGLMEFWITCLNDDCLAIGPFVRLAVGGERSLKENEDKAKEQAISLWNGQHVGDATEADLKVICELKVKDRHMYNFWPYKDVYNKMKKAVRQEIMKEAREVEPGPSGLSANY